MQSAPMVTSDSMTQYSRMRVRGPMTASGWMRAVSATTAEGWMGMSMLEELEGVGPLAGGEDLADGAGAENANFHGCLPVLMIKGAGEQKGVGLAKARV